MDKILISHPLYKSGMDFLNGKAELIIPNNGNSDEILNQLKEADGFILRIGKIDRRAIEACPDLKVIARPGVGVDNVDVQAATERGIPVVIVRAANSQSVAEHALALIFACAKNLVHYDNETRKGNFSVRNKYDAVELMGKTVSILGYGNIGRRLGVMCKAIGMKVVVYDPFLTSDQIENDGAECEKDLDIALSRGDFVSIHMPSLPSTRKMFNLEKFSLMKPTAYFINCARGDLVVESDLYTALSTGIIAGAGVDVLTKEPMNKDVPLMQLSNFIVTPHSAAQTREAAGIMAIKAAEGTLAVLRGEQWPDVCNPEVYKHSRWKKV